jgi:hypothetical protein
MIAGNMPNKESIQLDFTDKFPPPFNISSEDKLIIVNPFQINTLTMKTKYNPPNIKCPKIHINIFDLNNTKKDFWSKFVSTDGTHEIIIWIDPTLLSTEVIAQLIAAWKNSSVSSKNVVLSILIPKGETNQKIEGPFCLWKIESCLINKNNNPANLIWYPSLNRDPKVLLQSLEGIQPYDIFPLIEFPNFATQMGETTLTNHTIFLEKTRTRTRNFIYFDILHPQRAFQQFYGTLTTIPKLTSPVFHSAITPGGNCIGYLISLLSGVLTDSLFYTPETEIPIPSNLDIEGILTLRKIA